MGAQIRWIERGRDLTALGLVSIVIAIGGGLALAFARLDLWWLVPPFSVGLWLVGWATERLSQPTRVGVEPAGVHVQIGKRLTFFTWSELRRLPSGISRFGGILLVPQELHPERPPRALVLSQRQARTVAGFRSEVTDRPLGSDGATL